MALFLRIGAVLFVIAAVTAGFDRGWQSALYFLFFAFVCWLAIELKDHHDGR